MNKHLMTLGGLACAGLVQAHEGHGLPAWSHGHAADAAVLLTLAALIGLGGLGGLGLWLSRRK